MRSLPSLALLTALLLTSGAPSRGAELPKEVRDVQITEHLGSQLELAKYRFRDETGREVVLKDYFNRGRPVLLNLVYYECPNLCNFLLNGLVTGLKRLDWLPGREFEIVTVSINPHDAPSLAAAKKRAYLKSYGREAAESGWHFLTAPADGDEGPARALATDVGFGYRYDAREKQYAHSAAIFLLTPEGKLSRYLYGIDFPAKELRLGLLEASNGKVGTVVDRLLLFCYRYDPDARKYSLVLTRVMQAGSAGSVFFFGTYLGVFWVRQRRSEDEEEEKGV